MTIKTINIGTNPGDETGDGLRDGLEKINDNFTDSDNAASKLMATDQQALNGAAGVLPDAEQVHNAIRGLAVGTVSQSSGVPTGAIIERGVNVNGGYVKYADGTMICNKAFGVSAVNTEAFTNQGINYFRLRENWTFPSEFISAESTTISAITNQNSENLFLTTKYLSGTTSSVSIDSISVVSFSSYARIGLSCVAIGRWY